MRLLLRSIFVGFVALTARVAFAAEDLPRLAPGELPGEEMSLILEDDEAAEGEATSPSDEKPSLEGLRAELVGLEKRLQKVQARAANGERLFRSGVLSKVESEKFTLEVFRIRSECERVRHAISREELTICTAANQGVEELEKAKAHHGECERLAAETLAAYQKARLENAELMVSRYKKLYAAGLCRKAMVAKAEAALTALRAPADSTTAP